MDSQLTAPSPRRYVALLAVSEAIASHRELDNRLARLARRLPTV